MIDFRVRVFIAIKFRRPCYSTGLTSAGRDGFFDRADEDGEAEGAEFEGVPFLQAGSGRGGRDVADVIVVSFPFADIGEEGPDLMGGDVFGDDFVGDEVVCGAGTEFQGPDNC